MWRSISEDVRKLRESITWNFSSDVNGIERSKLYEFLKKVVALETEALENSVWENVEWQERQRKATMEAGNDNGDTPF